MNKAITTELKVLPNWIDFNGHMNGGYYSVAFDIASVNVLRHIGIDDNYRKNTHYSTFAIESHISYLGELQCDDEFIIDSFIADFDYKRMHIFHKMYVKHPHSSTPSDIATSEVLSMHIDMQQRKSAPYPSEIETNIKALYQQHQAFDLAPLLHKSVAIRR